MPVPVSPAPLRPTLLRDSVHDRLRDAIVDGTLAPGEVVRDTELATWLGVSRTPVREALLRLGETGLVRSAPGRSTVVAEIDLAEVREAHAVVVAMHRLAVTEAVARLTDDDVELMRAANAPLRCRDRGPRHRRRARPRTTTSTGSRSRPPATGPSPPCSTSSAPSYAASSAAASPPTPGSSRWRCTSASSRRAPAATRGAAADVAFRTWQNLADLIPDRRASATRRSEIS